MFVYDRVVFEFRAVSWVDTRDLELQPDWRLRRIWAGRGAEVELQSADAWTCEFHRVMAFLCFCLEVLI
jgi:hypothetical protein